MSGTDDNDRLRGGMLPDDPFDGTDRITPSSSPLAWKPFPTVTLPRVCADFVTEGAAALGCDEAYLGLPMLSALAGCIGNRRRIMLKPTWYEPAIIWTGIVGTSGSIKTPALHLVFEPLTTAEVAAVRSEEERQREYETALEVWKAEQRSKRGPRPEPPEPPERLVVSDTTVESLGPLLAQSPAGLILMRDELAGWIRSFDMYRGGRGADAQKWIEMHGGRPMIIDRKSGDRRTISIERAALSITGGIQPEILRIVLCQEHFVNGLAPRLLLARPPRRRKSWTDATMSTETAAALQDLYVALRALPGGVAPDSRFAPIDIPLAPNARERFIEFYNRHAGRQATAESPRVAASFAKLEGYAARFALVHYVAEQPNELAGRVGAVDLASIQAGIALTEWFVHEERRIYAMMSEGEEEETRRELVEIIRGKGGGVTPRELMQASRRYRDSVDVAKAALDDLVAAGLGRWGLRPSGPRGGQPTQEFVLNGVDSGGRAES